MPQVPIRGLSLHVQEVGAGPPVILLHGLLLGNLATWHFSTAPALALARRAILYDLRGHGMSERPPEGYGVASQAADLLALHEALAPGEPADLVGHSFGALVALRHALDHPHLVRRMVLVEAPLPPSLLQDEYNLLMETDPLELLQRVPADIARRILSAPRRQRKSLATVRALLEGTSLTADIAAEPDVPDETLARVRAPTLVVAGSGSSCLPSGRRLAATIPGARLLVLPGGHYLPAERPVELTAAITSFLDAPEGGT